MIFSHQKMTMTTTMMMTEYKKPYQHCALCAITWICVYIFPWLDFILLLHKNFKIQNKIEIILDFGALGMRSRLSGLISRPRLAVVPNRKVTDSAGAYLEPPHVNKYAFPQFIMYNIPFMIIGCMIRWDLEIIIKLTIISTTVISILNYP